MGRARSGIGHLVAALLVAFSTSAAADDEATTVAKQHFATGVSAYQAGKYELALREFQQAHARSHRPELYFNMAACEEHLEHFQAAALLFRQYLLERPEAQDREVIEARIVTLEARELQLRKPTAPPPKEAPKPRLKATWAMLGVTAAVGIAALGMGAYTITHYDDLREGCGGTPAGCSPSQIDGVRSMALATDVLIGVTAAAAVATVVVAIVESKRARAETQRQVSFIGNGMRF